VIFRGLQKATKCSDSEISGFCRSVV